MPQRMKVDEPPNLHPSSIQHSLIKHRVAGGTMLAAVAAAMRRYSAAVARHDEVVKQPGLFWDTLWALHSMLGTKFSPWCNDRKVIHPARTTL
ncbi:hypothetical protein AKJ16_DCAP14125 [Drosera capensis]